MKNNDSKDQDKDLEHMLKEEREKADRLKKEEEQNRPSCENCGGNDHLAGSCIYPKKPGRK